MTAPTLVAELLDELERVVVGKRDRLQLITAAFLAGGHVLLDDVPGVAKTLIARSFASASGLGFSRVQFTPDVLPADVAGATVIDLRTGEPVFRQGPIFANVVLADEINRAPAKTQAALLEAMQEAQVSADGVTHRLPDPFFVIATENPVESEGTYPLPEAQLDRFLVRLSIGYPELDDEREIVRRRVVDGPAPELSPVAPGERLTALRSAVDRVHIEPVVADYAVAIARATRRQRDLAVGVSPRGTVGFVQMARAWALTEGRDFVTPDDLASLAVPCLAHRVVLSDQAWARGVRADDAITATLRQVDAPSWE
ncbi:MAG: MoxR family ATPase [Ilumatobacter sp.]|nr:MoxR family ATPase [Ilumatobacter sp.]